MPNNTLYFTNTISIRNKQNKKLQNNVSFTKHSTYVKKTLILTQTLWLSVTEQVVYGGWGSATWVLLQMGLRIKFFMLNGVLHFIP